MKRLLFAFAAIAVAFTSATSCDEITDEQKDGLTKVLLAGEYGVISMTGVNADADNGNDNGNGNGFGESVLVGQDGKPMLVWVFNLDGTQFMAYNRVWKKRLVAGTWDVSGTTLVTQPDMESAPETSFEIISFENDLLTIQTDETKIVLKRLTDADKYAQLQSISFTGLNVNPQDGKVHLDPKQSLTQGGLLQLSWTYDPEGYEPYDDPIFSSSNELVATVSKDGVVTLDDDVSEGEVTITVRCDYVEASVTLKFYTVN